MRRKSTARLRPFRLLHLAIASLLLLGTLAFSEFEPSESDVFLEVSSELDTTLEGDSCPKQSSCTDCLKTGEGACKWCPRKSFGPGVFSAAKEGVCVSAHSPLENGCTVTEKENAFANKGWIFGASDEEPSAVCAAYKHIPKPNSRDALNPAPNPLRRSGFGTRGFIERIRSTVTSVGAHFRVGCSEGLDCLQCAQLRSKVGGACKFCPADSVVDRAYLSELPPGAKGTCFAVGSTDVHARDTYEHIKGACTVSKDENEHAVRGWLRGIDRDNPASPSQAKQICKSVSNPSSRSSSSSSGSSSSSSNSTSMSFRTMPALDTLQKNKITLRVLEGLSHELQQLLYLRSIDFAFFSTAFKSHFLPPSVSKSKVSAIVPHISMVSTPREEGFGFYRTLLSASAGGLMTNGGKQKIFVFRDVSYNNIWSAYVHMLTEVYQQGHTDPGTILSALKKKSKATLEGELMKNTEAAANDHNALDSPEGRVMRTSGKILLGLTIPFTFGLLSIAAESADMALMLSLDAKRQQNVELKTQILLAALYGYESELQKGRSCSILSNDCADGEYCKREFIFLPSDQAAFSKFPYSPKGFCAKTQTKLLDNGMACFLHSDCKSGHCSFGGLSVMNEDSNEGVDITARDGFARGDMGVSSEKHVTLTPEQRLIALSGVCMRVSSKGISGCRTISPRHEFAECPPPKRR